MKKGRSILMLAAALALILTTVAPISALGEEAAGPNVYTYMIGVSADQGKIEEMWRFDEIERMLNIRFDFIKVSSESFEEKKNLAFATNDLPDVFSWGLSEIELATYGSQGYIIALEDYINWEHTPRVMTWFEKIDGYESALYFPDGHIYDLQGFNTITRELANQRYWINKVWADEMIGHLPATLDEYYEYLTAVKEAGNIPISGTFTGLGEFSYFDGTLPILYGFGLTERTFEAVDGVVQFNPAADVYKEYLVYMNKLFTEGLIDSEYFTQTTDQYRAKLAQGKVAAFTDYASWVGIPDETIWNQYTSNAPMTSEYNDTPMWGARDLALFGHFIITKECDDPQDLIRVVNYSLALGEDQPGYIGEIKKNFFTEEELQLMLYEPDGQLAKRTVMVGDWDRYPEFGHEILEFEDELGTFYAYELTHYDTSIYDSSDSAGKDLLGSEWDFLPPTWNHLGEGRNSNVPDKYLTDQILEYNAPYYHVGWSTNIKFTAEEADELSLLQVDLMAYVDQMVAKFIIGDNSIDEFENFINECNNRGLPRLVEIYQTAYDRWASK